MLRFLEIAPMDSMFDYISRLIDFLPLAHYLSQQIPLIFIFLFFSFHPHFFLSFLHVLTAHQQLTSSCDLGPILLSYWHYDPQAGNASIYRQTRFHMRLYRP